MGARGKHGYVSRPAGEGSLLLRSGHAGAWKKGCCRRGHEQKTISLWIHLNCSGRSNISEGFCIFPYLYMKIPQSGLKATEIKTGLSELGKYRQISNRPFTTNARAWKSSKPVEDFCMQIPGQSHIGPQMLGGHWYLWSLWLCWPGGCRAKRPFNLYYNIQGEHWNGLWAAFISLGCFLTTFCVL